jgi:hypothetical protein
MDLIINIVSDLIQLAYTRDSCNCLLMFTSREYLIEIAEILYEKLEQIENVSVFPTVFAICAVLFPVAIKNRKTMYGSNTTQNT